MPIEKDKEIKLVDEKAIDFFVERLAEILLTQIEQEKVVQPIKKLNEKKSKQKLQLCGVRDVRTKTDSI